MLHLSFREKKRTKTKILTNDNFRYFTPIFQGDFMIFRAEYISRKRPKSKKSTKYKSQEN